jgi:transcriptional regulator with XRE-family HTH domain
MDHETVARELIRLFRGTRSQTAFSRHLGYRCNVFYTWESGRRWPTAATFFRVAQKAKADITPKLAEFLGSKPTWLEAGSLSDPQNVAAMLNELRGNMTTVALAQRTGVHRVSISRWLNGQAEPRLPDFLRLVDASSSRALDFVALFCDPERLPSCRLAWRELQAQRYVAYHLPWSHAVLRALELSTYKRLPAHREGWIAKRLGIEVELERECLKALAASKLIMQRRKRWAVSQVLTVDTRLDPEASRRLKAHWADVGRNRLLALEPFGVDLFSYNLFTVSEQDFFKIRDLHIAYFTELRSIVKRSSPAERIVVANLQLFRLDQPLTPALST